MGAERTADTRLRRSLPANRTIDQVTNHYLVEKAIADRLRTVDRAERKRIYATMYDELFAKVPDHPRLARRSSETLTNAANDKKWSVAGGFLHSSDVFLEFGPGDCKFAVKAASVVARA